MLKFVYAQLLIAGLVVSAPRLVEKREIPDAHLSGSPYSSFPLAVTATLGSAGLSRLGYAGSLANLYASDDYLGWPGYESYLGPEPLLVDLLADDIPREQLTPPFGGYYPRYAGPGLFGGLARRYYY